MRNCSLPWARLLRWSLQLRLWLLARWTSCLWPSPGSWWTVSVLTGFLLCNPFRHFASQGFCLMTIFLSLASFSILWFRFTSFFPGHGFFYEPQCHSIRWQPISDLLGPVRELKWRLWLTNCRHWFTSQLGTGSTGCGTSRWLPVHLRKSLDKVPE